MPNSKTSIQSIEELTSRYQKLDKEKTRVQTLLGSAKKDLEELLGRAEKEYGTRDLKALEFKLKELESENLEMRKQYQQDLNSIEKQLADVENQFDDSE